MELKKMEAKVFFNMYNYRYYHCEAKKAPKCCITPSITIPDLALTMDEMLTRYERGLALPIQRTPIFEDENMPSSGRSLITMDLIDIHNYKKCAYERLMLLKDSVDKVRAKNADEMQKRNKKYLEYHDWIDKKRNEELKDSRTNTP